MQVKDLIAFDDVLGGLGVGGKAHLLTGLAGRAAIATGLPQNEISDALAAREALGSTGSGPASPSRTPASPSSAASSAFSFGSTGRSTMMRSTGCRHVLPSHSALETNR